jgi:hypothetical protein
MTKCGTSPFCTPAEPARTSRKPGFYCLFIFLKRTNKIFCINRLCLESDRLNSGLIFGVKYSEKTAKGITPEGVKIHRVERIQVTLKLGIRGKKGLGPEHVNVFLYNQDKVRVAGLGLDVHSQRGGAKITKPVKPKSAVNMPTTKPVVNREPTSVLHPSHSTPMKNTSVPM